MAGHVNIGCSGYSYPTWGKGVFYPLTVKHGDELVYYSNKMPGVEINTTFHGLPKVVLPAAVLISG